MPESKRLDAVKRIEGHGRVTLLLDGEGRVDDAHFDVTEFRGFEKMVEGRMVWEMPLITSRVCGICPVSHHIAAVKAVDDMLGVQLPPTARLLRELLHLGGFVHDHALHFFFLAGPDFLTGDGSGSRGILGVIEGRPDLARKAIAIRKVGQRVVEAVGGQGHPVVAIPGGMSKGITDEMRGQLSAELRSILPDVLEAERLAKESSLRLISENPGYGDAPTAYMGLTGAEGGLELYDGDVAVSRPDKGRFTFAAGEFGERVAERTLPHTFAKVPYLIDAGAEAGTYRVGPLARLNLASSAGGERADGLLEEFRAELGSPAHLTLAYHWARMIELVALVERMLAILQTPEVTGREVRVKVERGGGTGASVVEAPRGTLVHIYEADEMARVTSARLIVATTHNSSAIDSAVVEAVRGADASTALAEDIVRRMELGIRAYDPCLSCATHEVGRMPLSIEVVDAVDPAGSGRSA